MKRAACCLILSTLVACGLIAQPKLAIDKMTVDLGTIYNGATKTGTITLKNIGNQTLKILRVQPSCGCTTVRQPKSELQPNESDAVEVSFNSTLYHGPVEKYVNIETNDPTSQYVAVKLTATIKEELAPVGSSYSVWLGNIAIGKKVDQTVRFANLSGRTISIKGITSSSNRISANVESTTVKPSDTLSVHFTAVAQNPGYDTATLTIETDSKNQPTVELKVYFVVNKEK
ncbi:MAG TPA: DUF1573 domain-containing protein [Bacteroidota bacterium]